MSEQLSAFVDAESGSESEASALFGRLRADEQLRDSWDVYHLIGDSLRGTSGGGIDRARFSARLAAEPTVLAPAAARASADKAGSGRGLDRHSRGARWAMPVAASLAAVAFVGWMASTSLLSPQTNIAQSPTTAVPAKVGVVSAPEAAVATAAPAASPAAATAPGGQTKVAAPPIELPPAAIPVANGVDDYLWAHQRFAPAAHAYRVRPARHEAR